LNLRYLLDTYFSAFSKKNIEKIAELISEDVVLKDWNIHEIGKADVLEATRQIFSTINKIEVTPICFYSISETSFAIQIEIRINFNKINRVIDLIEFDEHAKIKNITAYLSLD
jgi:hypothetical protein